jgi:hypothetical protein
VDRNFFGAPVPSQLASALVSVFLFAAATLAGASGFTPQARIGFTEGDQWEPAIASDAYGHVYVLYPQYVTVPECPKCPLPTMVLLLSNDNGATWQAPRPIMAAVSGQFDPQIMVDPADHGTVYAAWLQNKKSDIVVAKSSDFGQSWVVTVANRTSSETDKPVLAVRGRDVYAGFSREDKLWVAASHDGGMTFTVANLNPGTRFGWAQAGGATVDPLGNVYVSWAGYVRSGMMKGAAALFVSKSSDGGNIWSTLPLEASARAPECPAYGCGWAYLGAQVAMASDESGTLYALWNSGNRAGQPQRIYFSSSTTAGATWSAKSEVSAAKAGVEHAFPAIVAGSAGDVRIAWMDRRNSSLWNTFYRNSTNGGATWSAETRVSAYIKGYRYIKPKGFSFPFGDYFGMSIDNRGQTQVVWGEGLNYETPGSIWYSSGR